MKNEEKQVELIEDLAGEALEIAANVEAMIGTSASARAKRLGEVSYSLMLCEGMVDELTDELETTTEATAH